MAATELITAEQYFAIPDAPDRWFELVRGKMVEIPLAGGIQAYSEGTLLRTLHAFVSERDVGKVFGNGLGYITGRDPDTVRIPDLSFIATEHLPEPDLEGLIPYAPDFAIEFVPYEGQDQDIDSKVCDYLAAGTQLVWIIRPAFRTVHVYRKDGTSQELSADDELVGDDVLPDFTVRVGELFKMPTRPKVSQNA